MSNVIGACGYCYSGSSAITDLLHEFEDACVLDAMEFALPYYPDGLDDLDYHLNISFGKHFGTLPIRRFRKLTSNPSFMRRLDKKAMNKLTDEFLEKIVQVRWKGLSIEERDRFLWFFRRGTSLVVESLTGRFTPKHLPKVYYWMTCHTQELSARPDNFDIAAREYVDSLLDAMGRDCSKTTVLNQPFCANNPIKSFKYFDNPKAIIVDRDPRDVYLFCKLYLRKRGDGLQIAIDTVDEFIEWYKASRVEPESLRTRGDLLFMNFEELIYDYENAVKKVAGFCNISQHIRKGEFFRPARSRVNTQVSKKFKGFEKDIARIEDELPEFIFQFNNYPDVNPEGKMFL